jgi:hypothetical protein
MGEGAIGQGREAWLAPERVRNALSAATRKLSRLGTWEAPKNSMKNNAATSTLPPQG